MSMTHSLGMPSGVITDGLGFMYNGCMGVFDPRPGRAGSLAPGKARFSSVVPSIVFEGDRPHLVIGAPGATQIAMGVLQALLNALDFDMTMVEAVSAPRFSATSNAIDVSNRIPRGVQRELEARGYEVVRSPNTYGFAAVHAHPRASRRARRRRGPRPRRHRPGGVGACRGTQLERRSSSCLRIWDRRDRLGHPASEAPSAPRRGELPCTKDARCR